MYVALILLTMLEGLLKPANLTTSHLCQYNASYVLGYSTSSANLMQLPSRIGLLEYFKLVSLEIKLAKSGHICTYIISQ